MVRSRNGKKLLEQLPLSQTLLESNGPYITQQEKPVEPKQLTSVIKALAHRHQLSFIGYCSANPPKLLKSRLF